MKKKKLLCLAIGLMSLMLLTACGAESEENKSHLSAAVDVQEETISVVPETSPIEPESTEDENIPKELWETLHLTEQELTAYFRSLTEKHCLENYTWTYELFDQLNEYAYEDYEYTFENDEVILKVNEELTRDGQAASIPTGLFLNAEPESVQLSDLYGTWYNLMLIDMEEANSLANYCELAFEDNGKGVFAIGWYASDWALISNMQYEWKDENHITLFIEDGGFEFEYQVSRIGSNLLLTQVSPSGMYGGMPVDSHIVFYSK